MFIVLQTFLLPFKIDPFSESIILLELDPFSVKFVLIVFQNVLLSVMSVIFQDCVHYFLWNFYFSPNYSPLKTEKCSLFHLKISFCSRDIQVLVFSSSPLFLPASHCFTGWSKKNLKVCNVINCLNKNLIKHFAWYPEKEIRCDIEPLFIDWVLRNLYIEKSCRKCASKASPRSVFNFAK